MLLLYFRYDESHIQYTMCYYINTASTNKTVYAVPKQL